MPMSHEPSWRKPLGMFLILLLIAVWAVLVVTASSLLTGLPSFVHVVYYVAAGILWILPLKPLLLWMETGRWRKHPAD